MMPKHTETIVIQEMEVEDGKLRLVVTPTGDSQRAMPDEEVSIAALISNALYNLFWDGTVFAKIKADYGIDLSGGMHAVAEDSV